MMPAAFFGHGSPMNTLERNRYTDAWRAFGVSVARPRAVVCVSAHWFINATAVTAMPQPRTIHDFFGFPPELFAFEYPARGAPDVAAEVVEVAKPHWVGLDHDSWGLDHGTWSVLAHVYPDAAVPVVQLAINAQHPFSEHVAIGRRLAALGERDVMVIASGNIVHNLGRIDWRHPDGAFDWNRRFDDAARELMLTAPGDILRLVEHPDFALAVPTPDHFLPLLYVAGIAAETGIGPEVIVEGFSYGSLSMTSYAVGASVPAVSTGSSAAELPDPDRVPAEETNT